MSVELIRIAGDDLDVVNTFRVSLNVEHQEFTERDAGLIRRGMQDGHSSPFAQVWAKFRISCSIGCARQLLRHGHYIEFNEHSTRYSEMPAEFVQPTLKRQIGKSMDYQFQDLSPEEHAIASTGVQVFYQKAYDVYQSLLAAGISREDARYVLPLGMRTHLIASSHLKGWMRFLAQRTDPHAQDEIREDVAPPIEAALTEAFPVSMKAWIDAGRRAL